MAKYAVLVHDDQSTYIDATPEAWAAVIDAHGAFREKVFELGGQLAVGEALAPAITRITNGTTVTEGPSESQQSLNGYSVIEARDLDHAVEIAKHCPAPGGRGTEVPWPGEIRTRHNEQMAITQQLARLTSRQLEACSSDAEELRPVCWYTGLPKRDYLDVNWWLRILGRAALAGGAPADVVDVLVTAVDGKREVLPDSQAIAQVYSEVTCLDTAETAEVAADLAAVDVEELMAIAAKDDEAREYIVDIRAAFEQLRGFYRGAAERGLAMVLWWD